MTFRTALLALICVDAIGIPAVSTAQQPDARTVIAESQSIHTANGVEVREAVKIGGIDQWITVRGKDRNNPLLLYVHGGPGDTMMGVSWSFQRPWEDYFTVVEWDQRGAGKTYASNDWETVKPTLKIERFVEDAEEMVQYLRTKYYKQKIVLLGHSWGSVIGTELAQRHPEWFSVYIGTGQVVDTRDSERMGYEETLNRLSPDYTDADLKGYEKGDEKSPRVIWDEFSEVNFWKRNVFRCPVVLLQGSHDLNVSHELVGRWFATLQAPSKKLVWFPNSSHMPMMEEPGRFFYSLMTDVRPLAVSADAVAASK